MQKRTIACFELVVSRDRDGLVIDIRAVGGFEVDNEWSSSTFAFSQGFLYGRIWDTNLTTPFDSPSSFFSCTCRSAESKSVEDEHIVQKDQR
jgi:hypothetical protein